MNESPGPAAAGEPPDLQLPAEELLARYAQRLYRLAEQHLARRLAGRIDGEDVVQSAFRTFFRRRAAGEFSCDDPAQMGRLLVKITVLKARAKAREHLAAKRDARREAAGAAEAGLAESLAREPGPEEAAVLVDEIETLLEGLPPLYGELLQMRLEGRQASEIAAALGVSRQTVYRALKLLQSRLLRASAALPPVGREEKPEEKMLRAGRKAQ